MRAAFLAVLLSLLTTSMCYGHCQIPCGIYDDEARFTLLLEHVTTIEKSITEIKALSDGDVSDYNQLVRWIMNKEHRAEEIQEIALQYFLAQRVKEGQEHYEDQLKLLHGIIVGAMKTKQSLDEANVTDLRTKIGAFKKVYMHH